MTSIKQQAQLKKKEFLSDALNVPNNEYLINGWVTKSEKYIYFCILNKSETPAILARYKISDIENNTQLDLENLEFTNCTFRYLFRGYNGNLYERNHNYLRIIKNLDDDTPILEAIYDLPNNTIRYPGSYPIDNFTFFCDQSCDDYTIYFSHPETIKNVKSVKWDFGDGNTSTDKTTQHTYKTSGYYNVTLYLEYDDDVVETVPKRVYIPKLSTPKIIKD